ncbi:hypothetical protein CEXT_47521 [Caerostris extrusa]|uniref:Uncharacterized protein n=1 Tax=Caerostris extrusa TaxID=172846 RepID=A0AAV4VJM5_CAEEX|nr:hypothetical protein CEXT_47521 [Caerostris extrusa]
MSFFHGHALFDPVNMCSSSIPDTNILAKGRLELQTSLARNPNTPPSTIQRRPMASESNLCITGYIKASDDKLGRRGQGMVAENHSRMEIKLPYKHKRRINEAGFEDY